MLRRRKARAQPGEKQSHCKGKNKKNGDRRVGGRRRWPGCALRSKASGPVRCDRPARAMIAAVAHQHAAPRPNERACALQCRPASADWLALPLAARAHGGQRAGGRRWNGRRQGVKAALRCQGRPPPRAPSASLSPSLPPTSTTARIAIAGDRERRLRLRLRLPAQPRTRLRARRVARRPSQTSSP